MLTVSLKFQILLGTGNKKTKYLKLYSGVGVNVYVPFLLWPKDILLGEYIELGILISFCSGWLYF